MANFDCSSIFLKGICQDCQPALGGIKKIWIARYADLDFDAIKAGITTDATRGGVELEISAVPFKASATGAKWYEYQFRKNTGSLTSTLNVDEATGINYVQNDLSLVFTKMETAKRLEISALSVGQVAVIVLDANDKYWFLGLDEYVSASAGAGQTGVQKTDQNAYTITLSTASSTYPYELDADGIASLKTNAAGNCD